MSPECQCCTPAIRGTFSLTGLSLTAIICLDCAKEQRHWWFTGTPRVPENVQREEDPSGREIARQLNWAKKKHCGKIMCNEFKSYSHKTPTEFSFANGSYSNMEWIYTRNILVMDKATFTQNGINNLIQYSCLVKW